MTFVMPGSRVVPNTTTIRSPALGDAFAQQDALTFERFLVRVAARDDLAGVDAPAQRQALHRLVVGSEGPDRRRHALAGQVPRRRPAGGEDCDGFGPAS
jgi:hypothetical protein